MKVLIFCFVAKNGIENFRKGGDLILKINEVFTKL